ncbi:MAG: 4Fe-4S binding protein [Candidatus Symbiothrix sp.]|jgi:polyferredoxin|nr:4Fe-4S binding protein [Candidatus Symbiothrix sp.]
MKFGILKTVRVVLALLIFIPLFLYFCDFANILPQSLHGLAHIQIVPAILVGSAGILIGLFLLTFFFGRLYCSVICPLGILQDIITWFTRRGKKKNKKRRWFAYAKPQTVLRYSLLAFCVVFLIFGISVPLLYLDPYSNFGRIAVNLFRPVVMEGNNLVNRIALSFNNYDFYHVTIYTVTSLSLIIAVVALLVTGIMALLRGRLFCNTICPVGSLLGLISKFSVFRITLDHSKCTSCGLCEKACKSQCIGSKEKTVDNSRCVACFNCLDRCKVNGIKYRWVHGARYTVHDIENKSCVPYREPCTVYRVPSHSRRSFLLTSAGAIATLPFIPAWAKKGEITDFPKLTPITPPGSKSLAHFKKHCTACHLCITHCPQQILKPAGFNFGWDYAFKPHLTFYESAFCNYECTVCSEICPNGAIHRLTSEEKSVTQIGIARFDIERCVVYTDHTSCGACSEHCPTRAVKMEPFEGALTLPHVYDELCIGCGGCESICPVRPVKAINIQAVEVHQIAKKEEEEQIKEVDQDQLDFGF